MNVYEKGVDVSFYQGDDIDWNAFREAGYTFAIIKAGIRSNGVNVEADYFDMHFTESGAAGIDRGIYYFSRATDEIMAAEEADFTIQMLEKRGITPKDLPFGVWCDVEDRNVRTIGHDRLLACLKVFVKKMNEAGYYAGLYTNKDWLTNTWRHEEITANNIPIWMAQYNTEITFEDPSDIEIWQYTSSGSVPGIIDENGKYVNVDVNKLLKPREQLFIGQVVKTDESVVEDEIAGGNATPEVPEEEIDETNVEKNVEWIQGYDGKRHCFTGEMVKSKWVLDKEKYYWVDENGDMQSGTWLELDGKWYYLKANGIRHESGWAQINGLWYFFKNGVMQTGWIEDGGHKYYLYTDSVGLKVEGAMATGCVMIDGACYAFDRDGALVTNTHITIHANKSGAIGSSILVAR